MAWWLKKQQLTSPIVHQHIDSMLAIDTGYQHIEIWHLEAKLVLSSDSSILSLKTFPFKPFNSYITQILFYTSVAEKKGGPCYQAKVSCKVKC